MPKKFKVFQEFPRPGAGNFFRNEDRFQVGIILRTVTQHNNECLPHAILLQLVSRHGTDSVRDLGLYKKF